MPQLRAPHFGEVPLSAAALEATYRALHTPSPSIIFFTQHIPKFFVFLCFYVYSVYPSHYLRKGSFVCLVYLCVLRAWNDAVLDRRGLIMPQ